MSTPGNGDYRLREIERRLQVIEDRGSPATARLLDRLETEKEARKDADRQIKERLDTIENTLTWGIRLFIGSVLLVVVGILIAVATQGGGG